LAHKHFSARSLPSPEFRTTARWTSPETDAWDGRRDLAVDLTIVHPKPVAGRPLRGSAATFLKEKADQK